MWTPSAPPPLLQISMEMQNPTQKTTTPFPCFA
jgi:hypothetical protein